MGISWYDYSNATLMTTHTELLGALQEVLRPIPLAQRQELKPKIGLLAKVLGIAFQEVEVLFQDQRSGDFLYLLNGTLSGLSEPMTIQEAAASLGLDIDYLRIKMAQAEAKKREGRHLWYTPRKMYPHDGRLEQIGVRRVKREELETA